jgi:hypothetical protein
MEQRKHLCALARATIEQAGISNAKIIHGNIVELDFSGYDAFYIFNPFQENIELTMKIDEAIVLSEDLYDRYIEHVARQLAMAPLGTRVATYCGSFEEVPLGYDCLGFSLDRLRFWEKTKNHPVRSQFK